MSFNVSVLCVIFFSVNLGSLGSFQSEVSATSVTQPSHPLPPAVSNQSNPAPEHVTPVNASSEKHPSGRHLSAPKLGSNATAPESATNPPASHAAPTVAPPLSASISPHHVSVEIEQPHADNVIIDMTHSAAHQNVRAGKWNPTFAAIVAAICITTAVGGYIMLMAWRKIEMDRYGNRQMLINEDDFGDIQDEDMRHFEASCIQIQA